MKHITTIILLLCTLFCSAQTETYDIFTYTAPGNGWKKESTSTYIAYVHTNTITRKWCRIALYKNTGSKGDIGQDFKAEWKELAADAYKITGAPVTSPVQQLANGWKQQSGAGNFLFENNTAMVHVSTFSNAIARVSMVTVFNSEDYRADIQKFERSIKLPAAGKTKPTTPTVTPTPSIATGFAFSTTNFDDGWTSTIQQDWVEVTKGKIKVLLHYPKEGTIFPADPDPLTRAAWDILVAPRYTSLKNFKTVSPATYNRPYFAAGNVTDKSGNSLYVAFFRRGGGWLEFIAPDKNSFVQQFGADIDVMRWDTNSEVFDPLEKMSSYNKFAVAASDIDGTGKWSDHFASNTYYANIYTGASAGMSTYTSSQWFEFGAGRTYKWQLVAANSYGGSTSFAQAKGAGTFKSIGNWQLHFTNIEGKPKTYDVYFTATRGGRVLWMNDAQYPGNGIFTGYVRGK